LLFEDCSPRRRRKRRRKEAAAAVAEVELEATGSIPRGVYLCVASSASHDEDKAGWLPGSRNAVALGDFDRERAIPI